MPWVERVAQAVAQQVEGQSVGYDALLPREAVVTLQTAVEIILAAGAVLLLVRDVRRAWRDRLRRPVTMLMAALVAALLIGVVGGQPHPSPWWLVVPGAVLLWEVARGWRLVPRCHFRETGIAAFAIGLLLAAFGLAMAGGSVAITLLGVAGALGLVALALFWHSHRREPLPWRAGDFSHYERRTHERTGTRLE